MTKRPRTCSTRCRKRAKKEPSTASEEDAGGSAQPAGVETPETKPDNGVDITGWRVATTGLFMLRSRSELESALKQCGAAVTQSLSKRSTHLILGSRYEKVTRIGSPIHTKAVEFGLPIIGEKELWEMILPEGKTFASPAHIQDSDAVDVPADSEADADADKDVDAKEAKSEDLPTPVVTKWRIVLTGVFVSMSRAQLVRELERRKNTVSHMVTAKTTHLFVGGKTSTNYNGVVNGVGSFKYNEAKQFGIPIIREKDMISMLGIEANEVDPGLVPQGAFAAVSGVLNQEAERTSGGNDEMNQDGTPAFDGEGWRLVLVSDFGLRPREQLESELTRRGAAVLKARTGCTTHIVVGSEAKTKEYAVGSSEYEAAIANGITILSEQEMWAKLTHGRDDSVAEKKMKTAAGNVKNEANPVSSAMENGNTIVKPEALKLTISPASMKAEIQPAMIAPDEVAAAEVQGSTLLSTRAAKKETKAEDIAPTPAGTDEPFAAQFVNLVPNDWKPAPEPQLDAEWKKLTNNKKKEQKKATGKAQCRGCHKIIEKGTIQVKSRDNFLFSALGGNTRYGMYVEDNGTLGRSSISVNTFWVHDDDDCIEEAERKCNMQLQADVDEINVHRRTLLENE